MIYFRFRRTKREKKRERKKSCLYMEVSVNAVILENPHQDQANPLTLGFPPVTAAIQKLTKTLNIQ